MAKVAVVTGSNKGIGFEIAKKLGKLGFEIVLACRNEVLGVEAEKLLGLEEIKCQFRMLDISSKESVELFARDLGSSFQAIDVLVNNAAIAFKSADPTPFMQQARPTIHVNYFGTLWVTEALLPLLRNADSPKIVNIASEAGHLSIFKDQGKRDLLTSPSLTVDELSEAMTKFVTAVEEGIHAQEGWPNTCYGTSKAAVIALTKILAKEEPSIMINACCPGYCATDMSSHRGTKSATEGAETPVMLATLESFVSGKFFSEGQEIEW